MTFGKKNEEVFLGREIQSSRDYSEVTARMIDEEISRIVRDSQRLADEILRKDIEILHRMAKELLKYETIDANDLGKIIKGEKLTRPLNDKSGAKKQRRPRRRYQRKTSTKNGANGSSVNGKNESNQKNVKSKTSSKIKQVGAKS